MNRFKNHVIVAAVFSVLAIIGSIMNSHQAAAQGPPGGMSVNIVNPLPMPVTGSVTSTVTGTVGLASGTTVGLASGASVRVNNTVTDPVRVRNVNDAIQPFQAQGACTSVAGASECSTIFFTVPAGKRAVIEYFSGSVTGLFSTGTVVGSFLTTVLGHQGFNNFVPPISALVFPDGPGGFGSAFWGQQVRLYADPGSIIQAGALVSNGASVTFNLLCTISGYLVDVPFTP
jgi:hypothetical protein